MVQLKEMEEFQYGVPMIEEPIIEVQPKIQKPEIHVDVELPQSPKRRLRSISRLEKLIGFFFFSAVVGVAVVTIQIRSAIVQTKNDITQTQTAINQKQEKILQLEQQKSELSKADRIKGIAKKKGLSENDDNLRNVK